MNLLGLFKKANPAKIVPLFKGLPRDMRIDAVVKVVQVFPDTTSELIGVGGMSYYAVEFKSSPPKYSWQINKTAIKRFFKKRNYRVISVVLH